jgi:molecular chaperone DnaK
LEGTDIEEIKAATEKLVGASQAVSTKLYENAAAQSASGTPTNDDEAPDDSDVVDAEIVDEDESNGGARE